MTELQENKNVNIEALRILAMFMIIVGHAIGHNHLLEKMNPHDFSYYIILFLQVICGVATNIYVMISGYLLCQKRFKARRLLSIWVQVLFYSMGCYLLFTILASEPFSIFSLVKAIFPISGNQYWFARVYFGLYILMPFINIFIHAMDKQQHQFLLFVSLILFSFWRSFIPFATTLNVEGGNSIIWFIVLYVFASYVRLYGIPAKLAGSKLLSLLPVFFLVFSALSRITIGTISKAMGLGGAGASLFTEFTSFPMVLSSWFILMITIRRKDKSGGVLQRLLLCGFPRVCLVYI